MFANKTSCQHRQLHPLPAIEYSIRKTKETSSEHLILFLTNMLGSVSGGGRNYVGTGQG